MTQEEKAKAYDDALRKAKITLDCCNSASITTKNTIYDIFPELTESEDERIRKEIIEFLMLPHPQFVGKRHYEEWIAWLEKQGEQKPIEVDGEDYGIDGIWHAVEILKRTLGLVEGYQSDDGILEHKAAITAVEKLKEQKSVEWSEEDKYNINYISTVLYQNLSHEIWEELDNWLKSLKERIGE